MSKKNRLKPWRTERFCIPEQDRPRFVAHLEKILDVYCEGYDEQHPLVCMDEAAKQITRDAVTPLPLAPGRVRREDHHYEREGVRAVFIFFDPLRGWRRTSSRESRTRWDWAEEVRRLLEEDYPEAEKMTLVCDNLNTHDIASLYAAFPAEQAHRLARRLRIEHTPCNGSWLNMAEMELSVLSRECLDRRFASAQAMEEELAAWDKTRNAEECGATWRFTTADARIKLRRLYPQHDTLE